MAKLTTHVLNIADGIPAAGMRYALYRVEDGARVALGDGRTGADGRCGKPLLEGTALRAGIYELVFDAGDYFQAQGADLPAPRFVDRVVLRFGIADPGQSYHVPLLVSPWSWSTYRGS